MHMKVTLIKIFDIKTSTKQVRNHGLPILTLQLWKKQSNGTRNIKNINSAPKDVQNILSSQKFLEKYKEQTLLKCCVLALLDPKMFHLSDFEKNKQFPLKHKKSRKN